ncbi:MAG: methyltransferase domain-containing protein [Candidatus Acidiferrales bacterium]
MKRDTRWEEAQQCEVEFWDGMARLDHGVLRVLADNAEKAELLKQHLTHVPRVALEVGTGPFGLGLIGFLPDIPFRIASDPLPPSPMDHYDLLRRYVHERRSVMQYAVLWGEEIPMQNDSLDLVICCNVIDHASNPDLILEEIHRVLKPGGLLFMDVHTFSVAGLAKWHAFTKFRHKDEMLVIAHPYRMFETRIRYKLKAHGFRVKKVTGHTFLSTLIGHFRISSFLGVKGPR